MSWIIHQEIPAIAPMTANTGYFLDVLLNWFETNLHVTENGPGMNVLSLCASKLHVIKRPCQETDQSSFYGKSYALMELISVILEYWQ